MSRSHGPPASDAPPQEKPSLKQRLSGIMRKIWWLHSFGALGFGIGVMLYARQGLAYADKLLIVLGVSWLLLFVALRFIVGRQNRSPDEHLARKGIRVVVNYIIKNLYQQMFFFLVPIYASSVTWSLSSYNWWLPPLLLVFAVVSTMDLVFDNFIMERRVLASTMYGVALFGVLNLMLPLVLGIKHFPALLIAAGLTAPAVALLSFSLRSVLSAQGLLITIGVGAILVTFAWFGRATIPPAPLAMRDGAVGHGTLSSYECLPGKKRVMKHTQLDGLRCGSTVTEPGGLHDDIVHVWVHEGTEVLRAEPTRLDDCDGMVFRSLLPDESLPSEPGGTWSCRVETGHGQLLGVMKFEVTAPEPSPKADERIPSDIDAGPGSDAGIRKDARTPYGDSIPDASIPSDAPPTPDAPVTPDAGVPDASSPAARDAGTEDASAPNGAIGEPTQDP